MAVDSTAQTKPAVCCGCSQQCGVLVHRHEGRIVKITGDRKHPSSAGFVCPKGTNAHRLHYDPARVHFPLKRVGPRGSDRWERIAWEQALDEIAASLLALREEHGPETIAHSYGTFHGADWGLGERFMNRFQSPNSIGQDKICYGPIALGEALTYGFGPTFYTAPVPGVTRCVVLWGMRPSASMPLLWKAIVRARKRGAKLIVVDPERTREAAGADLWLQSRPGSDVALALALIHCIIEERLWDADFVREHTVGFDDLRRRAADFPPQRAEAASWVPAEQIVAAARLIAGGGPAVVHGGNGLCQSGTTAVQSGRALACLIAITGNLGIEGGHLLGGPPRDLVANGDALDADALSPPQRAKRLGAETFPHIGAGYWDVDEAMSPAWHGKRHILSWLATGHEPTLWQAIVTGRPYPVKALILQYHNALGAGANARAAGAALTSDNLELLVVHDLFLNPTSRLADYVLPAAHWLEKPFFSFGLGTMAFVGDYAEAGLAPIAPEHEHRGDYELWRDLGRRVGQDVDWPETLEEFAGRLLAPAGLDFDALAAHRGPLTGERVRAARVAGSSAVPAVFGTPSRKVELRSSLLEAWGFDPLPCFDLPPIFETSTAYPLVLTTGGRKIEGFHQNAQQMAWFRRRNPEPALRIHPQTAESHGIAEGDWVLLETPVGSVRQQARLTDVLPRRVVHADRWWYPERADDTDDPYGFWSSNVNVCTDHATENCDPIMGTWLLRGLPCRVSLAP